MVELNLAIDESYQSIRHRTIEEIRENSTLYWNLIYYFSQHDLPLHFLIPYVPKQLFADQALSWEVQNSFTLVQ